MTDKWAEHKPKFCGCKDASRLNRCQGRNNCELPEGHPERVSAAPRQPEGEGLGVVGLLGEDGLLLDLHGRVVDPEKYRYQSLCLLTDHQRAIAELQAKLDDPDYPPKHARRLIAELREECERLRAVYGSDTERINGLVELTKELHAERDTLRQQLEAITDISSSYLRELEAANAQRDRLAGLLREKFPRIDPEKPYPLDEAEHHCEYTLYQERERLHKEIDAALAEVKPCPESPHPAAT